MNHGIFKLVYSRVLNMYVPASEAVKSHAGKTARVRKHAKQTIELMLVGFIFYASSSQADTATEVSLRSAVNATVQSAVNSTIVRQSSSKAILDWNRLNIGKGYNLQFDQQGNRTWSALNRIHDLSPTILNGNIKADGNVYFINTNGIVFGADSQFNVGSLYAGTLDITDNLFNDGFIDSSGIFTPVFQAVGEISTGKLVIENGATINTAKNGKVVLFSEDIQNSGVINTPDGQTILAAGKKVYLASSKDPAGFMVEVDGGGKATNLGKIVADRGNITMMGLAVNQAGTLSASTSVRANGSIHLLAQDNVSITGNAVIGSRNGLVTLQKGSVTEISAELADKEETIVSQAFTPSKVNIEASLVNIDGQILAKGGDVTVNTAVNGLPASSQLNSVNPSRIFLGENALIDVSGVNAVAPMSRNQLEIQLFSDQLKDNPILRDSGLFKETIFVDARKGTELLDISPFLALKGATVAEKLSEAGTIKLATTEDLIISKNATLNISGGSITYEPGFIKETNLSYNGKLVPISEAKPGVRYDRTDDVFVIKDPKWGVSRSWDLTGGTVGWAKQTTGVTTSGLKTSIIGARVNQYTDGEDAGILDLTVGAKTENIPTKNLVLAGNVLANTSVSTEQLLSQKIPQFGELIASANYVEIAKVAKSLPTSFSFEQALPDSANFKSIISTDLFANGINKVDLSKTNNVVVNDVIQLKPNGSLTLNRGQGTSNQINANIFAPGSDINLLAPITTLADGVTVSSAGNYTNDLAVAGGASQIAALDGGNINAAIVRFGKQATLDASAGAWVSNKGNVALGHAGDISFTSSTGFDGSVTLQSYGFDQGGKLTVAFGAGQETLNIANNISTSSNNIALPASFFTKGGFSAYKVSAFNINIGNDAAPAQEIYSIADTLNLNAGFKNQADNTSILAVSSLIQAPVASREAVSLSFVADKLDGTLNLAQNTTLRTDIGGVVQLSAGERVKVQGDIVAPSGEIDLLISNTDVVDLVEDASKTIFIGEKSLLSVAGTSLVLPASQPNLLNTKVFNGGKININQGPKLLDQKGSVVIKDGAILDVSGASIARDTETRAGFIRETLFGDAGSIGISGIGGLLLDGDFVANATGTGRGGSLNILATTPTFTVTPQKQLLAAGLQADDVLTESNQASQIAASQIKSAGFANLEIKTYREGTGNTLELANNVDLTVPNNLKLDANNILVKDNGTAKLTANHITLKSLQTEVEVDPATIATGNGSLVTTSKQLFIDGLVSIAGVNQTNLNTSLDVTGKGTQVELGGEKATQGGIVANGDINISARQIYPATAAKLGFEAVNGKVTVNSNGVARKPVLSASGQLSLKGNDIVQNGVLSAPLGKINIEATNSATFTAGSVTSVSADNQVIPFAATLTGGEFYNQSLGKSIAPIDKNISITSNNIDLQSGATLDLSAGGDAFAYEWIPGIGGTQDVLANANIYAILPTLGNEYAPFDQLYTSSSATVGVGQSVFLTGVPGLATGRYTLLPARYALVPGAYMLEKTTAGDQLLPGQVKAQVDGSTLSSGYFANIDNSKRDANWSTFKVTDGAIFRPAAGTVSKAPSQYLLTSATTFFSSPLKNNGEDVSLPIDVAKLSLDAAKLNLEANVLANKQAGGSGLEVDISASNIRVVSSVGADDGSLQLTAGNLNRLNADSLLLGGTRAKEKEVVKVSTNAENVTIENDASNALNAPELLATATNKVTVKSNAVINTGVASKSASNTEINTNSQGALLALSSNKNISYSRTGASASATQGELLVEQGSLLKAGNSVVIDGTKLVSLADGAISLSDGAKATFGANRILIGNAPTDILGLNISASTLSALGQLSALTLNSYNNIDTFGAINLGNKNLDLTMNAAAIVGNLAQGEDASVTNAAASQIIAKTFTLKNTQAATFTNPQDTPVRDLKINATNLVLDGTQTTRNTTEIAGFNKVSIAAKELRVANLGETKFSVAETNINTNLVTGNTAADYKITSAGNLVLNNLDSIANSQAINGFGATLAIAAQDLTVANKIQLTSGALTLSANNELNINSGANISVASTSQQFYNKTVNINAGTVSLTSTASDVNVKANAVIDASSQGEANAGLVKVSAKSGTFNLDGALKGSASGTGEGGVLDVDVNNLANLTDTNKRAVGFTEARQYRVRTGDVAITGKGAEALTAKEVMVSADAGSINVSGDIIATAPKNSQIGLFANGDITLESTANIKANSTKAGEEGGKLKVNTKTGQLAFKQGSMIDVSGGEGAFATGEVTMRAPRTADNRDIQIAEMFSDFVGAKKVQAEGFKVYNRSSIVTADMSLTTPTGFFKESETFLRAVYSADAPILSRISIDADTPFLIVPGVEVSNLNGSLTLSNEWNLRNWRFDPLTGRQVTDAVQLETGFNRFGQDLLAGVLTLRARDGVNINNTLNDGFSGTALNLLSRAATPATTGTPEVPAVLDDDGNEITPAIPEVPATPRVAGTGVTGRESWSYRIVAGADNTAANPLATLNAGTITIATNRGVRTGTGDIEMAAGGDLRMNAGAVIYSVGRNADTLTGFNLPANNLAPLYLTEGGDVSIAVNGNVIGAESQAGNRQLINQWLFRQGGGNQNRDTSWWVRPDLFQQSLATLGGGDIRIQAAGNITNFSASAPTTARFDTNGTTNNQVVSGGGDVSVKAGGDITNGVYFVAKGEGKLQAGGEIKRLGNTFGTTLAMQDGQFNVSANKNVLIETAINPTLLAQSTTNAPVTDETGLNAYFNSYSDKASVNISSLLGDVTMGTSLKIETLLTGLDVNIDKPYRYIPSSLRLISNNADINIIPNIQLLPSATGQLSILASNDINFSGTTFSMSDADPRALVSIEKPRSVRANYETLIENQLASPALQLLHGNDPEPAIIVAKNGDINTTTTTIDLPKATTIVAGQDINRIRLNIQNNRSDDLTLIKAGNDIKIGNVNLSGPGELLLQAGRNIDLSSTQADIATVGNDGANPNPALPEQGASITLQAGLGSGAAVQRYIDQYILPTGAGPSVIANDGKALAEYKTTTAQAVLDYMIKITGNQSLTNAEAFAQFDALSNESKSVFVNRHLTSELIASAKGFAKAQNHNRGTSAIATLFPQANPGDILLFASKVSTNSGGSIDLIAPSGFINVGAPGKAFKDDIARRGDIGILTEKGGEIFAIANGDFQVNQSKVITQLGSDIAIWSTAGTIDAGRGSKTATSVPERIVQTDADGNTTIEVRGVATGSGIRAQTYDPNIKKGSIFLTAPTVDAGEAGIEAGDLFLVANVVLNAANIQVSGTSSGVPVAASGAIGPVSSGLSTDAVNSAVGQVAQAVSQSLNQPVVKPNLPSIISVDVISIGK